MLSSNTDKPSKYKYLFHLNDLVPAYALLQVRLKFFPLVPLFPASALRKRYAKVTPFVPYSSRTFGGCVACGFAFLKCELLLLRTTPFWDFGYFSKM